MRTIKASEISSFHFCNRAWWYQRKGAKSSNLDELIEGTKLHHQHGRVVLLSGLMRIVAYGLLLIALVLFTVYITNQFLLGS